MEMLETKAVLDNSGKKVLWEPSDAINVFYETVGAKFQATTSDISSITNFTGNLDVLEDGNGTFWAVYPFNEHNVSDGNSVTMTIPAIQVATVGSFDRNAFVTIAQSKNHSLQFYNVCGGVAFSVSQPGVNRVVFKGTNDEFLAGKIKATFDSDGKPFVTAITEGKSSIELLAPEGQSFKEGEWYYMATLPQTLTNGFIMEFLGAQKTQWINEKTVTIKRAIWGQLTNADEDSIVSFEDINFKAYCVSHYDINGDGEISVAEADAVKTLSFNTDNIKSLGGIKAFKNLTHLTARGTSAKHNNNGSFTIEGKGFDLPDPKPGCTIATGQLSFVDLSDLTYLTSVTVSRNNITTLLLNNCTSLKSIDCEACLISELDLSGLYSLEYISCYYNQLTDLDVGAFEKLKTLYCHGNLLSSIDVSKNKALTSLSCGYNQFSSLDVSNNLMISLLYCDNNQLVNLDVSKNTELTSLSCSGNTLSNLDVSNNRALTSLSCDGNALSTLNVSNNLALSSLLCSNNLFTAIDVSNNSALSALWCYNNKLSSLDVSNNSNLTQLLCQDNQLSTLDISKNLALETLYCGGNTLTAIDLSNNAVLLKLNCDCSPITSLDLSNNPALTYLSCYKNQLSSLDVSNNLVLSHLCCTSNPDLTELWLKTGQTISSLEYNPRITTIKYK